MRQEFAVMDSFIRHKGLRHTAQRERVLAVFLATEGHVTCEALCRLVQKRYPDIGYTTVYRALKLFCDAGLCEEVDIKDGAARYEHKYGHPHHDHLVCTECGRLIEVQSPRIEDLQGEMARAHRFTPQGHSLEIFGICAHCGGK